MDSALYDGYRIPPYYDSLIGKLIVHGRDRPEALARLARALGELIVDGSIQRSPCSTRSCRKRMCKPVITRSTGWNIG
jgi:biotin carboxylase